MSSWWTKNGGVNWGSRSSFDHHGLIAWTYAESSHVLLSPSGYTSNPLSHAAWAIRAQHWFPMQVRITVVAVSSGSSFSGWDNYVGGGTPPPPPPPPPPGCENPDHYDPSPTKSGLALEAEDFDFNGYFEQPLMNASDGSVAGLYDYTTNSGNESGSISVDFPHANGVYDITVVYVDENDGASTFALKQNGSQIDTWNGIEQECQNKYTSRLISDISISSGDVISIEGNRVDEAYAKIDYIDFVRINDATCAIMPLGNSITFDQYTAETRPVGDRGGYRKYLHSLLTAAGVEFDFVGSETSGQNVFPDPENAGFPGITAPQLLQLMRTGYNARDNVQETPGFHS